MYLNTNTKYFQKKAFKYKLFFILHTNLIYLYLKYYPSLSSCHASITAAASKPTSMIDSLECGGYCIVI